MSDDRKDSFLPHTSVSETAATAGDDRYKPTGGMTYRVTVTTAAGLAQVDVEAESGDDAAEAAHRQFLGGKVTHIEPAPAKPREKLTAKAA